MCVIFYAKVIKKLMEYCINSQSLKIVLTFRIKIAIMKLL